MLNCYRFVTDVSRHSKLSWAEHAKAAAAYATELYSRMLKSRQAFYSTPLSISQMLYISGFTGALIDVRGSEAANINPWEIRVHNFIFRFSFYFVLHFYFYFYLVLSI